METLYFIKLMRKQFANLKFHVFFFNVPEVTPVVPKALVPTVEYVDPLVE